MVVGDQRRIATVLFADLVGFTALAEALDPEQVKGLVDRCFDHLAEDIEAFGGRVDKVVGDAIVALFGAPVAHEDDAERAVRAGLRMQETLSDMRGDAGEQVHMRVGINTGEVLVGSVRAGREYTAMGDVVNTASRLQEAAEPGTVLVGPETHAATRDVVEYAAIDPVVAKGKRLPVQAWVAVRALAPPGQRQRRTRAPLIGRETELSLLNNVAATGVDRQRASLLVIHGEAGMGKSRLAAETAEFALNDLGALVLEGRCVPYGEANVWWPIAEAIRTAAGLDAGATEEETDAALRKAATTSLSESGRLDELERVVAGLHHLLGHDGLRNIDATRARDEAIRAVVALAEGFTHRQPVFVVLSDIHWAEQEVLDLVDTLLARLGRRRFVVLATARRALHERWTPSPEAANSVVLHLDPLDEEASHRLLRHLSDATLHPAMAAMLVDRAGGNPFYLEELVSLITDAGVHTVDQLLATEAGDLPTTLRGLVAARLDALVPVDRQILDDAAVLGRRNRLSALITMVEVKRGLDAEVVRSHLERLAAREFLLLEGDTYAFRSDVIREVAYSTLTKADRARAHAGIARWIEEHEDLQVEAVVDQIASHYAAAAELVADIGAVPGVPGNVREQALDWLRSARLQAEADFLPATIEALSTRSLGLISDADPDRLDVLLHRARARVALYELDAAVADTEEVEALGAACGDECAVAEALLVRGDAFHHRGAYGEALELLAEARDRFARLGEVALRADAQRLRGMVHMFTGDFAAADEALHDALALFQQAGDRTGEAWALQNLSWSAYLAGRADEAEQRVGAAMATFEELGDPGGLTWSRGLLAWVRFHQGRNEEAEALAEDVGRDARQRGELWGEAMMVVLTSSISLWEGRTDAAIERVRQAVDLFGQIDDQMGELQARCGLGRALIMAGRIDAGLAELEYAVESASGGGDEQSTMPRTATLMAAVQLGDLDLAESMAGGSSGADAGDSIVGVDQVAALALYHAQRGELAEAHEAVAGDHGPRGYLDCARALVAAASGDGDGVVRAVERLERHPHTYLDRAWADVARALALATGGDVRQGRDVLARTAETVDATDDRLAQAIVRLADASLAEYGHHGDAASVRQVAEQRLQALGIEARGWRRLLRSALGVVSAH